MMLGATSGLPGPGTGPASLSSIFSDRGGDELGGVSVDLSVDPLSQVLRTLDSISAADLECGDRLRGVVDAPSRPSSADASGAHAFGAGASGADAPTPSSARREEILDSASALFAERGYHGASLRDISRRVGISHPGMLHHFASKQTLLGAVIDRLEAHAQGLLDSAEALQSSPQSLIAALAGPWDPREHAMALLSTLSAEIVNPDHPGRYRIARLRLVHEYVLEQSLTGLAAKGLLVEGMDPKFLARTLFSLLLSLTVREHTVRELQNKSDADPIKDVQEFIEHCISR